MIGLDLGQRKAEVRNHAHGRTYSLGFDQVHVATGAIPVRPPLPGIDLPHVHGVQTLDDASALMADAAARKPGRVVVVGSGYIGLELAEAFAIRGASVTVVERADEVMTSLDPGLGALVATRHAEHGHHGADR